MKKKTKPQRSRRVILIKYVYDLGNTLLFLGQKMIASEIYVETQKNQKKQNDQKLGKIKEEKLLN